MSASGSDGNLVTPAPRGHAGLPPEEPGSRPVLTQVQLEVLGRYGTEQEFASGDVLFADGDATYDLVVVLDGTLEIVENYGQHDEVTIATYGPFEFLGEMGLLAGQHAYLTAVASARSRILRVPVDQVDVIMAEELDLSELILRAFLLRHSRLTHRGSGLTSSAPASQSTLEDCWRCSLATASLRAGSIQKTHRKPRHYCQGSRWSPRICPL
jgi:CRP-like cAMP-binding protein